MALKIYATFEGENQGQMTGDATRADVADMVEIVELEDAVVSAYDSDSGRVTGKRSHRPLRVVLPVCQATPQFFQACVTNENLKKVEFKWFAPNRSGNETHVYTTLLENANIVACKQWLPNCIEPQNSNWPPMQELQINFQRITWTHETASKTATDDWEAART